MSNTWFLNQKKKTNEIFQAILSQTSKALDQIFYALYFSEQTQLIVINLIKTCINIHDSTYVRLKADERQKSLLVVCSVEHVLDTL